uniref:Uncharacterized protein n=1 Tax=Knipowitschia caucasica TaxID=637954 RepID=A0AAV2J6N6_KNICA
MKTEGGGGGSVCCSAQTAQVCPVFAPIRLLRLPIISTLGSLHLNDFGASPPPASVCAAVGPETGPEVGQDRVCLTALQE